MVAAGRFPLQGYLASVALLLAAVSMLCAAADSWLFTSFRSNGETGVFFAISQDGRKWEPRNHTQPWITPEHKGMLMRDPFLVRGPEDGLFVYEGFDSLDAAARDSCVRE